MYWAENYNKAVRKFNNYKKMQDKAILKEAIDVFNETVSIDPAKSQTYSIWQPAIMSLAIVIKQSNPVKKAMRWTQMIFKQITLSVKYSH